ncbi:MAG: thioredoxin family protein [Acidobacteria bacterium]|nr:thioredoxin family protein [Acidobacteriota bacterium]MBK9963911.1 thioredoxin family protein [Holophagales bacterium]
MKKLLVVSSVLFLSASAPAADLKIGAAAPDFTLPSASDGKMVALKDLLAKNKAVAVIFVATKCPVSNAYNDRMAALAKEYAAKGIAVVGINSNKAELAPEVAAHAKEHGFTFPVVKDEGNKVADAYGAQKTPEVFVISPKGDLLYHGRIDESQDDPKGVKSPDLRNALEAILAGKPVPAAETKAFGCTIKRV